MATRRYTVQLKAAKPFTVEADSIYIANPGFLFFIKGNVALAAFPREIVEYVVEESLVASVAESRREATR